MVTKGDKPLSLLCLGLLAGGLGEGNGGQQSALCFKMSGLRQHEPVLLTFEKVRPDLEFRGCGKRRRCKAKSSDGVKHKNLFNFSKYLCHLSTLSVYGASPQVSAEYMKVSVLQSRRIFSSQLNPFKPEVVFLVVGLFCWLVVFFSSLCLLSDQALDVSAGHPHPPANCQQSRFWCHLNTAVKVRIKFLLERAVGALVNIARYKKGDGLFISFTRCGTGVDVTPEFVKLFTVMLHCVGQVNVSEAGQVERC